MNDMKEKAMGTVKVFLERKGYEIVDEAWQGPEGIGGIDLVAVDEDGTLVFADATVHIGTDASWWGKPARTFKHFMLSPDPGDDIDLAALRELACSWALKHFGDHEIAIVYHDDNARGHTSRAHRREQREPPHRLPHADPASRGPQPRPAGHGPRARAVGALQRQGARIALGLNDLSELSRLASMLETCAKFDVESIEEFGLRMVTLERRGQAGDEAFARVQGYLCDAAAICACYREHVGLPSKSLKSQIRDLQRALGRVEVPDVPDELARLLAEEKEEGAEEGARKVKEDWVTSMKRLGRFLMAALKVTLGFFVWLFRTVFK